MTFLILILVANSAPFIYYFIFGSKAEDYIQLVTLHICIYNLWFLCRKQDDK